MARRLLQFTVGWYEVGGGDKLKCQLKLRVVIFIMTKTGKNRLKWTAKYPFVFTFCILYVKQLVEKYDTLQFHKLKNNGTAAYWAFFWDDGHALGLGQGRGHAAL